MHLGAFSISLSVKNLAASRAFYEALGFEAIGGDPAEGWQILRGPTAVIGLFEGQIARNTLTFNPRWDQNAQPLSDTPDVREIARILRDRGLTVSGNLDPDGSGPGFITLIDPDGNPVLIDQHL